MQVVVVTGASAGIGRSTALAFARQGAAVGLVARNEKALAAVKAEAEAAGGKACIFPCDVSENGQLEEAAAAIEAAFGPIDIWVNSAMVTVFSTFDEVSTEEFRRVTDVTYHGFVLGTKAALKRMKPRNRGHIIQIGSALSSRSIPLQSAYCGAKHAIRGFTDSLRSELIHEKCAVQISLIQLPAFNTPQFSWARVYMEKAPQPLPPIHSPELAAQAVLWAVEHPQREMWVGWPVWQAMIGQKLFPGLLDHYMAKKAWDGQLSDAFPAHDRVDNLFDSPNEGHHERGPFTDLEITQKPILWQVPNQNFWVNSAATVLLTLAFLLGIWVG